MHVIESLSYKAGGPARCVVDLCDVLAERKNLQISLVSQSFKNSSFIISDNEKVSQIISESKSFLAIKFATPVLTKIKSLLVSNKNNIICNHGLWSPVNYWVAQEAMRYKIPMFIYPHGTLSPWALEHKGLKKRVAMTLYQRRIIEAAVVVVATSWNEYENIRKCGFKNPVAVIPNGVNIDATDVVLSQEIKGNTDRSILFMGRIHPVKGLLNLVQAWSRVSREGWRLCIAGPDEGGHLGEVMALIQHLDLGESVDYIGEVDGGRKSAVFANADLFVLPTFTENFGLVVAEALAHSVPVITTRGAPWADLETHGCGWWTEIGVEPLVLALREGMALSDNERRAMGARGREYVRRYDWDDIAQQTIDVYRWVLGQGPQPVCVRTE